MQRQLSGQLISTGARRFTERVISSYLALALSAFLAATLVPFGSEVALGAVILAGADPWITFLVASAANTASSIINWLLGRAIERYKERSWFPIGDTQLIGAQQRFARYGRWSLLFAWVPVVGDPLTFAAGVLRIPFVTFVTLVAIGKGARYAVLIFFLQNAAN